MMAYLCFLLFGALVVAPGHAEQKWSIEVKDQRDAAILEQLLLYRDACSLKGGPKTASRDGLKEHFKVNWVGTPTIKARGTGSWRLEHRGW